MNTKPSINIVWMKRDLRLQDHAPLYQAVSSGLPTLIIYCLEPTLQQDPHYSPRHWNFVKESIVDINKQLHAVDTQVLAINEEVIATLSKLQQFWRIKNLFSYQETGIRVTYQRDKLVKRFCKNNLINWKEFVSNGIQRGLQNRANWSENWTTFMSEPQYNLSLQPKYFIPLPSIKNIVSCFTEMDLNTPSDTPFQKGGTTLAWRYLHSFFEEGRYKNYNAHISKPSLGRKSCSRLSPYIAWGCISIKQVWQYAKVFRKEASQKRCIDSFTSRLRWQSHFIQKFEMEDRMEFESINRGFHKLKKSISEKYYQAWITGNTGVPIVDACMRCVNTTGYLNFRMRALVVSFYTHNLWQPWQKASQHLAQQFLDFEPGIHFPQLQMQAGETGINQLRIYNPAKNSKEHDAEGVFIKKWVPELENVPANYLHEPHLMPPLEQQFCDFIVGEKYPLPIVEIDYSRKVASDTLWGFKDDPEVQREAWRILKTHTLADRRNMD